MYPGPGGAHEELQPLWDCAGMLMTGARYAKPSATTTSAATSASFGLNAKPTLARHYIRNPLREGMRNRPMMGQNLPLPNQSLSIATQPPFVQSRRMQEDSSHIPGTDFEKVPKLIARYVEFSEFKEADTSKGYFCAGCVYFFEGKDECAIVLSTGESADGVNSERIAPYGMCALWKNASMMRG